jgi:hypothetical protein
LWDIWNTWDTRLQYAPQTVPRGVSPCCWRLDAASSASSSKGVARGRRPSSSTHGGRARSTARRRERGLPSPHGGATARGRCGHRRRRIEKKGGRGPRGGGAGGGHGGGGASGREGLHRRIRPWEEAMAAAAHPAVGAAVAPEESPPVPVVAGEWAPVHGLLEKKKKEEREMVGGCLLLPWRIKRPIFSPPSVVLAFPFLLSCTVGGLQFSGGFPVSWGQLTTDVQFDRWSPPSNEYINVSYRTSFKWFFLSLDLKWTSPFEF